MVLPRQPDRLVDALRVVFLQHIAPGVQLGGPGHLAVLVRQRHGRAQVVAVVVVDGDAGVLFFFLFLQLGLHAAEQACSAVCLFAQHGLGTGWQAVLQGVAQVVGSVLLHVARHGAEHGLHEGQGRRVVGVVRVGQACGDGLHQQVGLVLGVAAGRSAQAHQGREAAGFVDGVLYVAGVVAALQAFGVDEAVSVPAVVVGACGQFGVCAFHLLLEPAAQGVVGVAAVVAQLLGVALDLAAAHRYELVGSVVVQLLLAVVCLHLRDAVAAGVVAPDAVLSEADAVVFPALHGALPLACKVAQAHEVEVGVPPVGVDLGGPVVLGVRLARCTGCRQAVACRVDLPAGGGLGVLAVGGRSEAPGAVVTVAQQLRGLARGAGLFDGNELSQAVVVVAAAKDLADEGVDLGAGVRQVGVLQRLQARGAQGREAAQAVPLALHLQGVVCVCCRGG